MHKRRMNLKSRYMGAAKKIEEVYVVSKNIEYVNSVGVIIDNCLLMHSFGEAFIPIGSIRKLEFHKTRNLRYNVLFFVSALPLVYLLFRFRLDFVQEVVAGAYILASLCLALLIRKREYRLLIMKKDQEVSEYRIDKYKKGDARYMVRVVNGMIAQLGLPE